MEFAENNNHGFCPYYNLKKEGWCELYNKYPMSEYGPTFRLDYCLNERECFRCKYDSTFAAFASQVNF